MLFGRKIPFSATDAFPLSEAAMEFDDSSSTTVRHARRALDGVGPRPGERSVRQQWLQAGSLIGLYSLAMLGFYLLGVVDLRDLAALAALIALGCGTFWAVFRSGLHKKVRHRHIRLAIVSTALCSMLGLFYLAPVTQILLAPFAFVAVAYGIFTVPRSTLLALSAGVLALYAGVVGVHYLEQRSQALLRLEVLHWLALAASLPAFVVLTGKVQRLYAAFTTPAARSRTSRKMRSAIPCSRASTAATSWPRSKSRSNWPTRAASPCAWRCWISTISSASTTNWATWGATRCCAPLPALRSRGCGAATCSGGMGAKSFF
jgi:hypothetical protein